MSDKETSLDNIIISCLYGLNLLPEVLSAFNQGEGSKAYFYAESVKAHIAGAYQAALAHSAAALATKDAEIERLNGFKADRDAAHNDFYTMARNAADEWKENQKLKAEIARLQRVVKSAKKCVNAIDDYSHSSDLFMKMDTAKNELRNELAAAQQEEV